VTALYPLKESTQRPQTSHKKLRQLSVTAAVQKSRVYLDIDALVHRASTPRSAPIAIYCFGSPGRIMKRGPGAAVYDAVVRIQKRFDG
jgi:hypothetical protein